MQSQIRTDNLIARAMRSAAVLAGGSMGGQVLRLATNLVLTRLLFPEAFGLMALLMVWLVGLVMLSDVGIGPGIARSPRGDDPVFLDTAWTLQVLRGILLWLGACAISPAIAWFYNAPDLAWALPIGGLTLLIAGFTPTRVETATRHLLLGRVTLLDLLSQLIGAIVLIGLAWQLRSVWALVIGSVVGSLVRLALMWLALPGRGNRFRWNADAGAELLGFGKWIIVASACGFFIQQADRAILGRFLTLEDLGIYNIGFFLATFPMILGQAVTHRILIPLYRDSHPRESAENFRRMRRLRLVVLGGVMAVLCVMVVAGPQVVAWLYDDRYLAAQGVVVAVALVQLPVLIGMTYDQAALSAGDSRLFFLVMALRAVVQTLAFLAGVMLAGLSGALIAQFMAAMALHLVLVWLARRYHVWDAVNDLALGMGALVIIALAFGLHGPLLAQL